MKICVISTTIFPCPPAAYSGLEMVAWNCAVGLHDQGHEILLISPKGSNTDWFEVHETTQFETEQQAYWGYKDRLANYDVIIDHSWQKWSYMSKIKDGLKSPILGVLHAPINTMYGRPPPVEKPCFVAISKDQAAHVRETLKVEAKVAYNTIDTSFYQDRYQGPRSGLLFLARMSRIKGPHLAIEIAKKTGDSLKVVGDDTITNEPEYGQQIKESCVGNIEYVGGVTRSQTVDYYSRANCLLHMNKEYREPFGLAVIEAQSCGCPVIAFNNGAMRELIENGKTGFVVDSTEEALYLVKNQAYFDLDRQSIVDNAKRFDNSFCGMIYSRLSHEALERGW